MIGRTLGAILTLLMLPLDARAGIEAAFETKIDGQNRQQVARGRMLAEGERVRLDQTLLGISQTTLFDFYSGQVAVLLHDRKLFIETKLDDQTWHQLLLRGQLPAAPEAGKKGYRVRPLGERTMDGKNRRLTEVTWGSGAGAGQLLLWQAPEWDGLTVRAEFADKNGFQQVTQLHDIQRKLLPKEAFSVPADYARASSAVVGFPLPP